MKNFLLKLTLSLSILLMVSSLKAQFNYFAADATKAAETYTDLGLTGSVITTNLVGAAMTFDEDNSSLQDIGFTFNYNGNSFTKFYLNTNGFIVLTNTAPVAADPAVYALLTDSTIHNALAPFNTDLEGAGSPEYRVATSGVPGSGICTIQFKGIRDFDESFFGGLFPRQYDSIEFQIKLYETSNQIDFVYGNFVSSGGTSDIIWSTVGVKGNDSTNSVNASKTSVTAWAAASFINSYYTGNFFNNRNTVLPVSGLTFRFGATVLPDNDLSVSVIYGYGGVVKNNSDTIKALIVNTGVLTQTNTVVSLDITGANPFTDTKTISSIAPGEKVLVTFLPYTAIVTGNNTATVSIPMDDNTANNTNLLDYRITTNLQSVYTGGSITALGFSTASDFVQRFSVSFPAVIDQLNIGFMGGAASYRAAIFDASGANGMPGATPIWESGDLTTPASNSFVSIPVSPIVSLTPGNFYVGVRQLTATSTSIIGEDEIPVRKGEIFYRQGAGNWIDFSPLNDFKLAYEVQFAQILPVAINQFKGEKKGIINNLSWNTASEINSKGFDIERSRNGSIFSSIGSVTTRSVGGFSNQNLTYSFDDNHPLTGTNFYRLKQIDKDGKITFSQIVSIIGGKINSLQLNAVYPNPAKNSLNLSLESPTAGKVQITITDFCGKKMYENTRLITDGNNSLPINVSMLPAGNYVVKAISAEGKGEATSTFIKN
jgi:hypothetical protein